MWLNFMEWRWYTTPSFPLVRSTPLRHISASHSVRLVVAQEAGDLGDTVRCDGDERIEHAVQFRLEDRFTEGGLEQVVKFLGDHGLCGYVVWAGVTPFV